MAAIKPDTNNAHSLGTTTHKWSAVHAVDVQSATITTTGDVEIGGNLTVLGDSVQIDVSTLAVENSLIELASNNAADLIDIGFYGQYVNGGTTYFTGLYRDATDGKFKFFKDLTSEPSSTVPAGGGLATIVCDIEGTIEGVAAQATALETARTISVSGDATGSVSFDGTADVDIALTISNGSVENGMLVNSAISFTDGSNSESIALGQQVGFVGTLNKVDVSYDAGSNTFTFTLPATISADLNGNASTATALETSRTISISGDATGSASFDGTANSDIALTISAGAVENSMLASSFIAFSDGVNSGNKNLGESLSITGTANEVEVAFADGAFTVGLPATISAALSGNASTATALETSRTLSVSGDATGSASFDGSANADIALTIAAGAVENSMLANSVITFGDGSNTEAIALGESITIQGTANEVDVEYAAVGNIFTVSLPATISADLSGNAATASSAAKWTTARTLSVSGDATGSASVDGSANADIALTIAAGAVENSMLVNNSTTFSDGSNSGSVALGSTLTIQGTANEVDVSFAAGAFTIELPATISADVSGNAATATALETSRTLSVSGDATGSASFDGSANADIALTISAGAVENSMLANSFITFGDSITTEDIDLGQAVSFVGTANEVEVVYSAVDNTFTMGLPATISADLSGNASTASSAAKWTTARTLSVSGDATGSASVDGSANADIALTIAAGAVENSMLANAAITFGDGSNTEAIALGQSVSFVGTADEVEVAYDAGSNTFTMGLPATISADLSGNASTASSAAKWTTARTLSVSGDATGSASFDGSANADIALTIAAGAVENSMLANSSTTFSDGSNSGATSLGGTLTIQGTANEVEVAYAAGAFTVGLPSTITADVNGNAGTATKLATARSIAVSGAVSGSANFDGSANINISTTLASGNLITVGDGSTSETLAVGGSLSFAGTANEVEVAYNNVSHTLTVGLPSSVAVNAATATALETSRTLSVSGDATGSASFDGSANADIALTIAAGAVENSMLANSSITVGDGSTTEAIALGQAVSFLGTANKVDVSYSAFNNSFSFTLPTTVSADISGKAATADQLETARTLSVSGDATGSVSFDGSANADIALTISAGAVENSMLANSGIALAAGTNGTGSDGALNLGETLTINGTTNEVNVAVADNAITIGLPDNVSIAGNLTVVENINCYDMTISGTLLSATAASTVRFGDTLLQLGATNVSATVDHGYYSQLEAGSYLGMCYDGTASEFMCFTTDTAPSSNTVNTAAGGFAYANLHVAGLTASSIVNGTLTLPSTNGTNGQVLTSNGSGATTWATPIAAPAFQAITSDNSTVNLSVGAERQSTVMFAHSGTTGSTVNLPSAATAGAGYEVIVKHGGEGGNITINRAGSDTIWADFSTQSATSLNIGFDLYRKLVSDGTSKWYVVSP